MIVACKKKIIKISEGEGEQKVKEWVQNSEPNLFNSDYMHSFFPLHFLQILDFVDGAPPQFAVGVTPYTTTTTMRTNFWH